MLITEMLKDECQKINCLSEYDYMTRFPAETTTNKSK